MIILRNANLYLFSCTGSYIYSDSKKVGINTKTWTYELCAPENALLVWFLLRCFQYYYIFPLCFLNIHVYINASSMFSTLYLHDSSSFPEVSYSCAPSRTIKLYSSLAIAWYNSIMLTWPMSNMYDIMLLLLFHQMCLIKDNHAMLNDAHFSSLSHASTYFWNHFNKHFSFSHSAFKSIQ